MKYKILLLFFFALALVGCRKQPAETPEPLLDVTANNLSGIWKLTGWSSHTPAEGTYVYIEFTRRDQLFTIYQNLDSFSERTITGRYHIELDEELGAVIRGQYDYGRGDWAHRYVVNVLTQGTMIWTATDDAGDISYYERCTALPEELQ